LVFRTVDGSVPDPSNVALPLEGHSPRRCRIPRRGAHPDQARHWARTLASTRTATQCCLTALGPG
jgi:hypothetical protein